MNKNMMKKSIMNKKQQNLAICSGALCLSLGVCGLTIFGISNSNVSAEQAKADKNVEVQLNVNPYLSLSTNCLNTTSGRNEINLHATESNISGKTLVDGSCNLQVETNSLTGYVLNFSDANTSDDTDLVHVEKSSLKIPTFTEVPATGYDATSFLVGYWGYAKTAQGKSDTKNGKYFGIPKYSTPDVINSSTGPVALETTVLTIGAKVDDNKFSGEYDGKVVITAVASAPTPTPDPGPSPSPSGDNATSSTSDSFSSPRRSSVGSSINGESQTVEESDGQELDTGYSKPKGVKENNTGENEVNNINWLLIIIIIIACILLLGLLFFLIFKRRKDDDEEENQQKEQ